MIQRRCCPSLRWKLCRRFLSYLFGRLRSLAVLSRCRLHQDQVLTPLRWKCHGHVGVDATSIGLTPADSHTKAKHKYKFCVLGSNTSSFKFSFATRTIRPWNSLPARSVELAAFKADIKRYFYAPHTHRAGILRTHLPRDTPWGGTWNIHQDNTSFHEADCSNDGWPLNSFMTREFPAPTHELVARTNDDVRNACDVNPANAFRHGKRNKDTHLTLRVLKRETCCLLVQ